MSKKAGIVYDIEMCVHGGTLIIIPTTSLPSHTSHGKGLLA